MNLTNQPTNQHIKQARAMSRVLLEKLKVPHLVHKFPALYATCKFGTVYTADGTCPCPEPHKSKLRPVLFHENSF